MVRSVQAQPFSSFSGFVVSSRAVDGAPAALGGGLSRAIGFPVGQVACWPVQAGFWGPLRL